MVDILKAYGLILSGDCSEKLSGYFVTDWSHLRLCYNDKQNKIMVYHELYMKHTITYINKYNELVLFTNSVSGNGLLESFFGDFTTKILHCT